MSRPAIVLAAILIALVLLPAVVAALVHPGDATTYQLGAAATSTDRLPDGFSDFVARRHDRTPPTAPPTTTTTRPPSKRTTAVRAATVTYDAGTVNGYPCGADLPPCTVLACESGGNPTADNPTSSASGLWQILDGTWNGHGGYVRALHAPADVQNDKARQLWNHGDGAFHWKSCL